MKKVLVATPSYDGKVDVWYANSLAESIRLGLANNIYFAPIYMSYDALIQRSRNDLIAIAIENEFDDIIWIDSDIEWNPEWLLKILDYDVDVVGGTYPKKAIEEQYTVKCKPEDLIVGEDGLIRVESLGTGFLRLSKKAIQYLWDNSEPYTHNGQERRWIFEVKIQDGDIISEDVMMCQKLRNGGFDIHLDPSMTCNHIGTLKFSGNFADFIERIKGQK
jgi:hypothetical protein